MTLEEVRSKISESENKEWFNNISLRFYNSKSGFDFTLKGFSAVYEYVDQQISGWNSLPSELPLQLVSYKKTIIALQQYLITFIQKNSSYSKNNIQNHWNNQIVEAFSGEYVPYNMSEVDFLLKLNKSNPEYINGSFEFLFGKQVIETQLKNRNNFIGTIMAYEFLTKENSEILSRRDAESNSITNLKKDFEKYLTKTEEQIIELFQKVNTQKDNDLTTVDQLREDKKAIFDKWHNESRVEFEAFRKDSNDRINDLKKTYEDLLRLKEPAEYWSKRAEKLKKEANWSLTILVCLILLGGLCLYFLLWKTPEGMLKSFFNEDKSMALRWSIVFITFISLIFIGVRMISKVMFSSYHLARDAEERQQLTYVYLSLRKDATVDDKDKQLIMQSLFSRADTGLLKEDSSPTMPGSIDKFIKS